MSFPKKCRSFPGEGRSGGAGGGPSSPVAREICGALRRELGATHAATKTVVRWTGASERTVKNWFAGLYGPNEEHLVALARHSDGVLVAFLSLAGRTELAATASLLDVRERVRDMLAILDAVLDPTSPLPHSR